MKRIEEVNAFAGVDSGGNCLPGPYRPFGMVRPGPDTEISETRNTNGYRSDLPIARFSQVHVSGTGGGGRYGNIAISPYCGGASFETPLQQIGEESASPGYYSVRLEPAGIRTEITCTQRTGVYRITYPSDQPGRLLIDAGATIRMGGNVQNGKIDRYSPSEINGHVELVGGWGHDHPYTIYFHLKSSCDFSNVRKSGLRIDAAFETEKPLTIEIGISFISEEKALQNLTEETENRSFDELRAESEDVWEKMLSRVAVTGGTPEDRQLHYTMLYRLLAMPGDLGTDDEFPRWKSGVRHFHDFFCLWDSCRNANGFFDLAFPEMESAFLNCLLDIGEHTGWIPDAWMSFNAGFMQGGCSADLLFAQAALKNLSAVDPTAALNILRKNHEEDPPDRDTAGRYMTEFREAGYVSTDVLYGCASRHLEYTFQDYALARLAEKAGDLNAAEKFRDSAGRAMALWHPDKHCFFPRKHNGEWIDNFDITQPFIQGGHYSADPYFFEGTAVEWSLTPLHVMDRIVQAHGGPEAFTKHLDRFFAEWIYKWKEIILHTPYLYLYAGRPDRTADCVLEQRKRYSTQRDGLPDNEDMGSQSAFAVCTGIGIYPAMGQDFYWLSPPLFDEIKMQTEENTTSLTIRTSRQSPDARYIGRILLNGTPINRAWVYHHELAGSLLEFELVEQPQSGSLSEPPPCC